MLSLQHLFGDAGAACMDAQVASKITRLLERVWKKYISFPAQEILPFAEDIVVSQDEKMFGPLLDYLMEKKPDASEIAKVIVFIKTCMKIRYRVNTNMRIKAGHRVSFAQAPLHTLENILFLMSNGVI